MAKKPKKINLLRYEFFYGALACTVSAAFALLAATLLPVEGKGAVAVFAALFLFSVAAGCSVLWLRVRRTKEDAEVIADAVDRIVSGDYAISFGELSSPYDRIALSVKKLADVLQEGEKAKSDFIGDFSHELKTPIVSIRGFAKLLAKGNLPEEEKREYAEVIAAESDRLIGLTTETLLINKLDNGAFADADVSFSLSETLRKCLLLLQDEWEKKDLTIEADFKEFFYVGNERLLSQLFLNLIENAVKYSLPGGKVTVSVADGNKAIAVTVADEGVGMTEETLSRMYDKYYRGDKSRSTPGNGLGLSIVKRIADLTETEISARSRLGEGTVFTVTLKK
ncbi:MAG: HAMP domain-containing sensor histidine kinase [Candidatus Borkfalkiaceae bacterium]|nr:HAMP domain-containing sensor histidine kinase [Christensenellaceae bacterium]